MKRQTIMQLSEGVLAELEKKGYSKSTTKGYQQAFARIGRFAAATNQAFPSEELIRAFVLKWHGFDIASKDAVPPYAAFHIRAMRMLVYYEENDNIAVKFADAHEPPECFRGCYNLYISECVYRHLSEKTVVSRSSDVLSFLGFLDAAGIGSMARAGRDALEGYLAVRSVRASKSMPRVLSSLRCFLRSMFANGVLAHDISVFVPSASRYPTKPRQKLWKREEIERLLGSIERTDSVGKRDYAIALLLVRYGMRSSDILNLRLSDLDWDSMTIGFCQNKTSVANRLPILDDVGWALADWLTNARPRQAQTDHVFIRMRAPYTGMGAINLLSKKRMSQAGIAKDGAVCSGPHSLRHALATNMLDAEIPLPVISAVLGHSSTASTSVYLHSDIKGLRRCALDVEGGSHEY